MSGSLLRRAWLTMICAGAALCCAAPAQGAASDPLFVFVPVPTPVLVLPPPTGNLEGPCGLGVDPAGRFYVSDYYHHAIDVYNQNANYNSPTVSGATGYITQLSNEDPLDGPCGMAFDASGNLYVNNYHRNVVKFMAQPSFGTGVTLTGATLDSTHPTGVAVDPVTGNVYVDQRTYVAVFDESGAPVMDALEPLKIGAGDLEDSYGIAFSQFPGTAGRLYVPDAATNTVKVYDPALDKEDPVTEIDGSGTPNGRFVSLRDASVAVDRVTGEVYVLDNLQPQYTDSPQAIVYVFSAAGAYEGHLKLLVEDGLPVGLAVDNSATPTQGRVYVTSGNTAFGAIYAYGPGAATTAAVNLPTANLPLPSVGSNDGAVKSSSSSARASFSEQTGDGTDAVAGAIESSAGSVRRPAMRHHHRRHRAAHRHQHKSQQRPHRTFPRRVGASR